MTPTEHLLILAEDIRPPKRQDNLHRNWVGQKKKKDKRIGMGPVPLGGSCEGGKVSTH